MAVTADSIDAQIEVLLTQLSKAASVKFKDRETVQRSTKEIMDAISILRAQKLSLQGGSGVSYAAFKK